MVTRRWEADTRMVNSWPQDAVSLPDHIIIYDISWLILIYYDFFDVSWCIVYYVLIYVNIAKFCPQDEASLSDDDESGVDVRIFFSTLEIFFGCFLDARDTWEGEHEFHDVEEASNAVASRVDQDYQDQNAEICK